MLIFYSFQAFDLSQHMCLANFVHKTQLILSPSESLRSWRSCDRSELIFLCFACDT